MLKHFFKSALVIAAFSFCGPSFAQDSQSDREQAADRYFKAMPFDQFLNEMSVEMAKQLPAEQRADFIVFMTSEVRIDVVLASAKASFAKHFTTEEINALAAFMESPVGKSSMGKMKYYMADIMPVVQAEVARAVQARKSKQPEG